MNRQNLSPDNVRVALAVCILLALSEIGKVAQAQTPTNIPGDLTVNGEVDIYGNTFNLGSWANDTTKLGLSTTYAEAGNHAATLSLTLSRPVSTWLWQQAPATGSGVVRQMMLGSDNALTLYN